MKKMISMYGNGSGPQGAVLVIQYNWEENIKNNEKAWVYYKKLNENSIHGDSGDGTFNVVSKTDRTITICHVPTDQRTRFICPFRSFQNIHNKSILSLDVTKGGLGVSASSDNKLLIWQTDNGTVRRRLEGHLIDVYSCRFFPSGVVVLSGGADMLVKIWDAPTGVCPVTLKGHSASVTATCIVEKGRNIITASKDGTVRLWNCAECKCIATLLKLETEINCCDIIDVQSQVDLPQDNVMLDEHEFFTRGKLLAVGCEDGRIYLISVASREIVITHFLTSSVLTLCWLPTLYLVMGLEDGRIMMLDAKNAQQVPQLLSHDSNSPVLCMTSLADGIVIGRGDGICQFYNLNDSVVQFTGPNCDPVYAVSTDQEYVYTACRDSVVRKYLIRDMEL